MPSRPLLVVRAGRGPVVLAAAAPVCTFAFNFDWKEMGEEDEMCGGEGGVCAVTQVRSVYSLHATVHSHTHSLLHSHTITPNTLTSQEALVGIFENIKSGVPIIRPVCLCSNKKKHENFLVQQIFFPTFPPLQHDSTANTI